MWGRRARHSNKKRREDEEEEEQEKGTIHARQHERHGEHEPLGHVVVAVLLRQLQLAPFSTLSRPVEQQGSMGT